MNDVTGYSRAQIALHWATLLLLIVSFFSHDGMKGVFRLAMKGEEAGGTVATLHRLVGLAILALTVIRVVIRMKRGAPEMPPSSPLLIFAAKITHLALYALLVAIPLSGLTAWIGLNRTAAEAHEVMFNLLFVLVGLHVVAAIYHQFMLKDGLMERMRRPG